MYSDDTLSRELKQIKKRLNVPFISLDDTHIPWADDYLHITNTTNPKKILEWNAKPGSGSLLDQISKLTCYPTVALVDIGAASGKTIFTAATLLERAGIRVQHIVLGIASKDALHTLRPLDSRVHVVHEHTAQYWIELKDLLCLDGRLFRNKNGELKKRSISESFFRKKSFTPSQRKRLIILCKKHHAQIITTLNRFGFDHCLLPYF